jgi:hypothetical protein
VSGTIRKDAQGDLGGDRGAVRRETALGRQREKRTFYGRQIKGKRQKQREEKKIRQDNKKEGHANGMSLGGR